MNKQITKSKKWILKDKHDTIVKEYQDKIQRILKDYQIKIMIQSRRINILTKAIKQQNELIDSFVTKREPINVTISIEDNSESDQVSNISELDIDGEPNIEYQSEQITLSDEKKETVLAINIQPDVIKTQTKCVSQQIRCEICGKSFSSKRMLLVS